MQFLVEFSQTPQILDIEFNQTPQILDIEFNQTPQILDIEFNQTSQIFDIEFNQTPQIFDAEFKEINVVSISGHPTYDGDYIITPKVDEQLLETQNKLMSDNMLIKSIPIFETENMAGGNTIYIGSEIDLSISSN